MSVDMYSIPLMLINMCWTREEHGWHPQILNETSILGRHCQFWGWHCQFWGDSVNLVTFTRIYLSILSIYNKVKWLCNPTIDFNECMLDKRGVQVTPSNNKYILCKKFKSLVIVLCHSKIVSFVIFFCLSPYNYALQGYTLIFSSWII